jgi:hypothetical protein
VSEAERVLRRPIEAFAARDEAAMRATLDDELTASVTTADGGVEAVHGGDASLQRLLARQAPSVTLTVTQSVTVAPAQAPAMVEIHAERTGGRCTPSRRSSPP